MDNYNENGKIFPFELIKFPSIIKVDSEGLADKEITAEVSPFVEKVKNALSCNLQEGQLFGCKIVNCHTHAGSKIHFNSFVEAELLFHNSYFNERFASLTVDYIRDILKDKKHIRNILLIGYEKYSELFLTTLRDKIEINRHKNREQEQRLEHCEYCIYETNAVFRDGNRKEEASIRRLKCYKADCLKVESGENDNKGDFLQFDSNNTLCLFIVPINTSLSTMDKMVAKFKNIVNQDKENVAEWIKSYLCLITLYSNDEFFDFCDRNGNDLITFAGQKVGREFIEKLNGREVYLKAKRRFENISDSRIRNFVISRSESSTASHCKYCFPDNYDKSLTDESPMFGVNRGSVVPMLKFGRYDYLKPINNAGIDNILINFNRIWRLSQYMEYRHVVRGDNHFQYYFHTEKFLEREIESEKKLSFTRKEECTPSNRDDESIISWLKNIGKTYKNKANGDRRIFDYLVAPRHSTNARFVYLVKTLVFNGQARIIFFDVDREYRSNLTAKYSDLISAINNIKSSNFDYEIRFHFVDDMINSGTVFLNAKNLISSIIAETDARDSESIHLFYDGILLINRMSVERQNFYITYQKKFGLEENYKNFHYFVNINISPMRNHEDACTLCKLGFDYIRVRENCATNTLADVCSNMISNHKLQQYSSGNVNVSTSIEKRYLFFITHLINERLANKFFFDAETVNSAIESERNSYGIKILLDDYYKFSNISKYVKIIKSLENDFTICDKQLMWQIAFIKSISRPFFIYHIRRCQSAFSFCLEKLNEILFAYDYDSFEAEVKDSDGIKFIKNSMLIQTLVKALADTNANYVIRKEILDKLIYWAKAYGSLEKKLCGKNLKKEETEYIDKRLFKPQSLLHYIKKDLVLSRDTTKSLLLEHILLEQNEQEFFEESGNKVAMDDIEVNDFFEEGEDKKLCIGLKGKLYLENNLILRKTLQDDVDKLIGSCKSESVEVDNLYFFENFGKVWKLNTGKELSQSREIFEKYKKVLEKLIEFKDREKREEFSKYINQLFENLGAEELKTLAFLHDGNEEDELFDFFTVAGNPSESGEKFNSRFPQLLTSQAFFHEENIVQIRSGVANAEDLFFIDDVLSANYDNDNKEHKSSHLQSLIIRFGANRSIDKQKNVNNKGGEQDDSIYFQIWGFDKSKRLHWFALKLLLSLRDNFVQLIEAVNLQELIEERKIEMQKTALIITKAVTHCSSDSFINYNIYSDKPSPVNQGISYRNYYNEMIKSCESDNVLFDKYFHVMANEYISSLYRRLIKGESLFTSNESVCSLVKGMLEGVANEIKVENFVGTVVNLVDRINAFGDHLNYKLVNLHLANKCSKCKSKKKVASWNNLNGSIASLAHVLFLFIVNVAKYAQADDIPLLDILINDEKIVFSNKVANAADNVLRLEQCIKIPPWVYKRDEDKHITLWTLLQANKKRDRDECLYIELPILENGEFNVTILFKKKIKKENKDE